MKQLIQEIVDNLDATTGAESWADLVLLGDVFRFGFSYLGHIVVAKEARERGDLPTAQQSERLAEIKLQSLRELLDQPETDESTEEA